MPLWIVIMVLGATGCGFLFLKARGIETKATYKKVTGRTKTVRQAAKKVAKRPTEDEELAPLPSEEPVYMSRDVPSMKVSELEELMREKSE